MAQDKTAVGQVPNTKTTNTKVTNAKVTNSKATNKKAATPKAAKSRVINSRVTKGKSIKSRVASNRAAKNTATKSKPAICIVLKADTVPKTTKPIENTKGEEADSAVAEDAKMEVVTDIKHNDRDERDVQPGVQSDVPGTNEAHDKEQDMGEVNDERENQEQTDDENEVDAGTEDDDQEPVIYESRDEPIDEDDFKHLDDEGNYNGEEINNEDDTAEEMEDANDNDNDNDPAIEEGNGLEELPVVLTVENLVHNTITLSTQLVRNNPTDPTLDSMEMHSLVVYSVNCLGNWGSGFTKQIKARFPGAFKTYKAHCDGFCQKGKPFPDKKLAGTCLVMRPDPKDSDDLVWHVCLFTSYGYGRAGRAKKKPGKDSENDIKIHTAKALKQFRQNLEEGSGGLRSHPLWTPSGQYMKVVCPQFNSGSFKIPWVATLSQIIKLFKDWSGKWSLLREEEEEEDEDEEEEVVVEEAQN